MCILELELYFAMHGMCILTDALFNFPDEFDGAGHPPVAPAG